MDDGIMYTTYTLTMTISAIIRKTTLTCIRVKLPTLESGYSFRDIRVRARSSPMSDADTHLHLSPVGVLALNTILPILIRRNVACLENTSDALKLCLDAYFFVAFDLMN
jgi:hypothetical protein